jgi:PPOX class probable F420-dependent enzyme
MQSLQDFEKQKYLNLETFRKNGKGEKTPVWFALQEGKIYVQTVANSGKVKRIRNNDRVNIAPCKVDGKLVGGWTPATAHEVLDHETTINVNNFLNKKYGLMKLIFSFSSRRNKIENTILEIIPD